MWKWISVYPQQKMYRVDDKEKSKPEEMCVCIAENWSDAKGLTAMSSGLPGLYGRAYSVKNGGLDPREDAILYGANFAEQFEYAISCDPSFIYITGWNEWVAGRYEEMWGTTNALPDNALPGYSRDIEPSTGVLKDHYYYQMVSYIRRFKGVNRQQSASAPTSVDLTKGTAQWENVTPVYESYPNNTFPRDADGYAGYHYTNTTGRNDIVSAKVTYDADYVYFMVQTKDALTSKEDSAWMRLLIGITGSRAAAWEGYHFIVNRASPAKKTSLERSIGGWNWEKVCDVDYSVQDNMLQIAIPRSALGVTGEEFSGRIICRRMGISWISITTVMLRRRDVSAISLLLIRLPQIRQTRAPQKTQPRRKRKIQLRRSRGVMPKQQRRITNTDVVPLPVVALQWRLRLPVPQYF